MKLNNQFDKAKKECTGNRGFDYPKASAPVASSSYTAKSVILDIADNHASTWAMGLRSIDFYLAGVLVDLLTTDITCYATSTFSTYTPDKAFITALEKIDAAVYDTWYSQNPAITNQRVICVFNSPIEFNKIIANNHHDSGSSTDRGINNTKIYISSDAIISTIYDEAISNGVLIYDGVVNQHVASNVQDDQTLILI